MGSGNGLSHAASSVVQAATFTNVIPAATAATKMGVERIRQTPELPNPQDQMPPGLNQRAPDTVQYSQSLAQSQKQATTAGGTIFGKLEDNRRRIGDNPLAPRKSLLGL